MHVRAHRNVIHSSTRSGRTWQHLAATGLFHGSSLPPIHRQAAGSVNSNVNSAFAATSHKHLNICNDVASERRVKA